MMEEIERKFLVKEVPDLTGKQPIRYERYYLENSDKKERRIQRKGDKFELEELIEDSNLTRQKTKKQITEQEFKGLKKSASNAVIRDSSLISESPQMTLKVYHDKYDGLIRAEVEFSSEEEAKSFEVPNWFGKEITNSPLGRDSRLLKLSEEEFQSLINT